jgi:hypothetical protein
MAQSKASNWGYNSTGRERAGVPVKRMRRRALLSRYHRKKRENENMH